MTIPEINIALGDMCAELTLASKVVASISSETMKGIADFIKCHQQDFEEEVLRSPGNKGLEMLAGEIRLSLLRLSSYPANNLDDAAVAELRRAIECSEIIWLPFIETAFPNLAKSGTPIREDDEKKDPMGLNKQFGSPGSRYRSVMYDLVENPAYPHLTPDVVYNRLKRMVGAIPSSGADISRLISLALKHGLLKRKPCRESIVKELGMTASVQSLTELIDSPDEPISESGRLRAMEDELLRK